MKIVKLFSNTEISIFSSVLSCARLPILRGVSTGSKSSNSSDDKNEALEDKLGTEPS